MQSNPSRRVNKSSSPAPKRPSARSRSTPSQSVRHFTDVTDVTADEFNRLVDAGLRLKQERLTLQPSLRLQGRVLGLFFEKPSMRTRVSFESAMYHEGGSTVFLTEREVGLGQRESIADFARVISRYVDILAIRTFEQAVVTELALHSRCPVINALSDAAHPCQALADIATIKEKLGELHGRRILFVGDGNNVARSLAQACIYQGATFVLCAPKGYEFDRPFLDACGQLEGKGKIVMQTDPHVAAKNADVVYTDVWASMGQETEKAARAKAFAGYQVNADLMQRANPHAVFLHCLPAHRGEEVTADVIDGPQSLVIDEAENRLHAQKSLILWLLGKLN